MTITIFQNETKKGDIYYSLKAGQSGTLYFTDGKYDNAKKILALSLNPENDGDYEVLRFENKKVVPAKPFEYPVTVQIRLDAPESIQDKALVKLFELQPELVSGLGGSITYADTPSAKRIVDGNPKPHDLSAFADVVAIESKLEITAAAGGNGGYGGSKGQTEAERIADRVAYIKQALEVGTEANALVVALVTNQETDLNLNTALALIMGSY